MFLGFAGCRSDLLLPATVLGYQQLVPKLLRTRTLRLQIVRSRLALLALVLPLANAPGDASGVICSLWISLCPPTVFCGLEALYRAYQERSNHANVGLSGRSNPSLPVYGGLAIISLCLSLDVTSCLMVSAVSSPCHRLLGLGPKAHHL